LKDIGKTADSELNLDFLEWTAGETVTGDDWMPAGLLCQEELDYLKAVVKA
jgi:hypothetical protein